MSNFFADNLKYLRLRRGMEQIELANLLGRKSSSSVSEWEKGTYTPKSGTISDIAKIFGVTLSDLMEKDLRVNFKEIKPRLIKIPKVGRIPCGEPIDSEENIEGYRYELAEGLPAGDLFALEAIGDSMMPTISNGSHVIIKKQTTVDDGQVAAVRFRESGEVTLKRVKRQGNIMLLIPDNKDYDTIVVTHDNPADIVGRAVRITLDI
ncbi:LexA family protein [Paenisporosarcina cavernae]|uniref:XRE family transcriptional regulator n=1 Tax=Paenisporosarcina cavernae TaxID=2320858 RepID=A0A385YSN1_9BACL|nr:XRE family transcriptional regulator [Paenisporosarcina cavernae]AYC29676.1 XRE family transcriptional regulator [Paenisporosarcina cavernae]